MDKKSIRILYLGTPKISADVLEKLIENGYNIIGVISQQDKPQGRKMIIKNTPVKEVALSHNIPVFQPEKLNKDYGFINELNPDLLLTMAYGQIISNDVLNLSKLPPLNLHGSLLPKYRGASPIQASLLNGDKETGVTLMEMIKEMDAGRIFGQKTIKIDENDNYDSLKLELSDCAFDCFDAYIQGIIDGENKGIEQDPSKVTFTSKILPSDQLIDFKEKSWVIINKIRALNSEPGTYFAYKGEHIKIGKASFVEFKENTSPARVKKYDKNGFFVETLDGIISLELLQKPSKKMMDFKSFFNGNQNFTTVDELLNE